MTVSTSFSTSTKNVDPDTISYVQQPCYHGHKTVKLEVPHERDEGSRTNLPPPSKRYTDMNFIEWMFIKYELPSQNYSTGQLYESSVLVCDAKPLVQ